MKKKTNMHPQYSTEAKTKEIPALKVEANTLLQSQSS